MESYAVEIHTKIREILESLSSEERRLLSRVLDAEREKLYMQKPRGINESLWKAITEVIR